MKINFFVDNECHVWNSHHELYIIHEDQEIYFELTDFENNNETPLLFVEDYELSLTKQDDNRSFRTIPELLFRESFGLAIVSIHLNGHYFELRFEVLVKKVNAQQIEEMIHYLTQKHNDIIRICFSHTPLSTETKEVTTADPETVLTTIETFVDTLISCRLELQHHLRKRLIPIKQPAWKASQCNDIDPFDIIFNLDILEPVLGEGDVVVNGRSYSIAEIEATTLEPTADVEENAILLGGLYSMRRKITHLLTSINAGFPNSHIPLYDSEYESLSNVLLRLTAASMKQRCQNQLDQLEEFIRYFEKTIGISYQGERHPIMTPFVRAVRIYRRLFEQLHLWYELGELSLDGSNGLVKLRSVSKIYEFVALFKIIDYLYEKNWRVANALWHPDLEFIPSTVVFERNNLKLTLSYEAKIVPYNPETKHLDLVDMKHSRSAFEYNYWCPDFVIRLDARHKSVYLILDAKYSSANNVKNHHLPTLFDKYFMNMAVYDADQQLLRSEAILGVVALFPDKDFVTPVYMSNWGKHGIHRKPIRLPIITGVSILPKFDNIAYQIFDQLFEIAQTQLKNL